MGTKYRVVRTYYNEECMKEYYHNMGENLTLEEAKGQILIEDFVRQMVVFLETQNHVFDKERFIKACYKKVD